MARDGWRDLGGVTLLTTADAATVGAWYGEQLADHTRHLAAQGQLFIRAPVAAFVWDRDYHKYPNVAVLPAPPDWAAAGYRTVIELNRPAP